MTTTKTSKAETIAECINIVAKYFNCNPSKVLTSFGSKTASVTNARHLIWYHLYKCGMSYNSIGRIFGGIAGETIQRKTKQGVILLDEEELIILATLPKVGNSIIFSNIQQN